MFKKAERKQARLRLALSGPSGSGKTYSALLIAKGLGGKIAVLDTEHESASLYAGMEGIPEFDTCGLEPPYSPERYIEVIKGAEAAGYNTLIIDSYSHEWMGSGGCLEINDQIARAKYRGNTWSAWNETTPRHRKLIDKILATPLHIICTMRSKTETAQGEDKKVVKLGMKSEQREGSDYEFTTVLDMTHGSGGIANASKDRTRLFQDPEQITEETGQKLLHWLNSGSENPDQRAQSMVVDFIATLDEATTVADLQAAFAVAWRELNGQDHLQAKVQTAYEARKQAFTARRQETAYG
ncbi:AAA domain-containing protein [Azomonas agilis]|uniref:AAA domain-containing protein n=1 Tax=Azomonas agilis TaxID=116849 RepID=A0A562HZL3_9GAMM|nr:ATP-binding protein [Azomonas agilis]TWH63858.1 AAA domain-containing protein [Azomonas agilis]